MLGLLEIRQHTKEAVKTKQFYIYNSRERDTAQDNDTNGWSDDLGHDSSFESLPVPRNVCPLSLPTFISLEGDTQTGLSNEPFGACLLFWPWIQSHSEDTCNSKL